MTRHQGIPVCRTAMENRDSTICFFKKMPNKSYRSDESSDDDSVLDAPESVLNAGAKVLRALDVDHHDGHEQEEERRDEADSGGGGGKMHWNNVTPLAEGHW